MQTDAPSQPQSIADSNALRAGTPLVALYCGRSLVSQLIKWQTRSIYSHAGLLLPDGSVIEGWYKGGVARNPSLGSLHTPGTEVHLFQVSGSVFWPRAVDYAKSKIGQPYDFRGVLRFISRRNTPASYTRWFCSELVFEAIRVAGLPLLRGIEADEVSPALLSLSPFLHFVRKEFTSADSAHPARTWFSNPLNDPLKDILPAEYEITPACRA